MSKVNSKFGDRGVKHITVIPPAGKPMPRPAPPVPKTPEKLGAKDV